MVKFSLMHKSKFTESEVVVLTPRLFNTSNDLLAKFRDFATFTIVVFLMVSLFETIVGRGPTLMTIPSVIVACVLVRLGRNYIERHRG